MSNQEQVFVQEKGQSAVLIPTKDFIYPQHPYISMSPDGRYALIRVWVDGDFPAWWANYQVKVIHDRVTAYHLRASCYR